MCVLCTVVCGCALCDGDEECNKCIGVLPMMQFDSSSYHDPYLSTPLFIPNLNCVTHLQIRLKDLSWRCSMKSFYKKVITLLRSMFVYDNMIWSWSVQYDDIDN